ncbi:hypothetical protein [Noviherbaspirillum sp.]|uniref:hypothetical protein n=1 Tax=Noviherbaspirillum sp. TaxID=1926288 RepID=UPI002FE15923
MVVRLKRRMLLAAAMFCACAMSLPAAGADAAAGKAAQSKPVPKPVVLRGTLGDAQIQMDLRPKADVAEGWEGHYFLFGQSAKILLAGEYEDGEIAMEESENGTDVSGQWNGKFSGDTLVGEWMSVNGTTIKPFKLKIVPETGKASARSGKSSQ